MCIQDIVWSDSSTFFVQHGSFCEDKPKKKEVEAGQSWHLHLFITFIAILQFCRGFTTESFPEGLSVLIWSSGVSLLTKRKGIALYRQKILPVVTKRSLSENIYFHCKSVSDIPRYLNLFGSLGTKSLGALRLFSSAGGKIHRSAREGEGSFELKSHLGQLHWLLQYAFPCFAIEKQELERERQQAERENADQE